ncbi:MAG: oxidoreductase [Candidatus Berkelbacteria bacterium]|nr:oxidoreductase [Candidatus Berkelbacteria bacterium]
MIGQKKATDDLEKTKTNNQNRIISFLGIVLAILLIWDISLDLRKDKNLSSANLKESNPTVTSETNLQSSTNIDDDPYLGDKNKAKIAIVEFSDYECPFCKRFHDDTFNQIVTKYVNTSKAIFVYRDLPIHGDASIKDATAAECVKKISGNNKYFEMSNLIFQNLTSGGQGISSDKLIQLAGQINIDKNQFATCLNSNNFKDEINKDAQDANKAGIEGTPGFVIGVLNEKGEVKGELVVGAQPFSTFESAILRQLSGR